MTEKAENDKKAESTSRAQPKTSRAQTKTTRSRKKAQPQDKPLNASASESINKTAKKAEQATKQALNKASEGLKTAEKRLRNETDTSVDTLLHINDKKLIVALYIGILFSLFTIIPLAPVLLASFVFSKVKHNSTKGWIKSHYQFQIRTFLLSFILLALIVLFGITIIGIVIAVPLIFLGFVWLLLRNVIGLLYALDEKAYPNPKAYIL